MDAIQEMKGTLSLAYGPQPSAEAAATLEALRTAVGMALDRKRRLGQYAVVWQGGQVVKLSSEALPQWPPRGGLTAWD